jgi:DNA topoisomerase-1
VARKAVEKTSDKPKPKKAKPAGERPARVTRSAETPGASAPSLVVVESPAKAKTIAKYLGRGYRVMASIGHVKDLPKSGLGIDLANNFTPEYVTIKGKGKVLSEIKAEAKKAGVIYLASDPDREGEAIAWHLAEEIKARNGHVFRVRFNEITASGVQAAMAAPTHVDMNLVNAQQARRVVDRLVGYRLSPLLWEKVRYGLSAGRVQSVAMRLICEREREVAAFIAREYWSITALLTPQGIETPFRAKLTRQGGETVSLQNAEEAEAAALALRSAAYTVSTVEKKERKQRPSPPFITSRLQQDGVRMLRFSPKKTMQVAQQLYEGIELGAQGPVGLITYMRTDSVRISPDFQRETLDWIEREYGRPFRPDTPNAYKSKNRAQEAHEAIRPTTLSLPPERVQANLTPDQYRLYDLIWKRYVASQMSPALLDVTRVDIAAGDFTLRATGTVVRFPGFTLIYTEGREVGIKRDEDESEEEEGLLPALTAGERLSLAQIDPKQHFTQPPPRYNEALLIHDLEEKGIGRPSTYAPTLSTIQEREYVERREGRLFPTELGTLVNDLVVAHFPDVIDVAFTAKMEEQLDQIEAGEAEWVETIREFYTPFAASLEVAQTAMRNLKTEERETDLSCEKCARKMVIKWGRFGKYLACPGYPDCKNTQEFVETAEGIKIVPKETITDTPCTACGKLMALKTGRFGRFMACTGYPDCKTTQPIPLGVTCPEAGCGGALVEKQSRAGKTFYSCNRYPDCKFALWDRPVPQVCPECNAPFMVEKISRAGGQKIICRSEACSSA